MLMYKQRIQKYDIFPYRWIKAGFLSLSRGIKNLYIKHKNMQPYGC